MPRPEVKVSKVVLDKFFKIREEQLELRDGRTYDHLTLDQSDTAHLVIIRDDKITLAGEYRHSAERLIWSLPSGYIEEGETPEECMIREAQEEVGLKPLELTHLITSFIWSGISGTKSHIFFTDKVEESFLPNDETEDILVREFSMAEVNKFLQSGRCDAGFAQGVLRAKEMGLMSF